jgi:hypothetical protein
MMLILAVLYIEIVVEERESELADDGLAGGSHGCDYWCGFAQRKECRVV